MDANARNRTLALAIAESIELAQTAAREPEAQAAPNAAPALPPAPPPDPTALVVAPPVAPAPTAAVDAARNAPPAGHVAPASPALAFELAPIVRYVFTTSTPYLGLDAGAGVRRFAFQVRFLAGHRSVEDGSLWQGALLGVASVDWLRIAARASVRSEVELGAALAVPKAGESSVGRNASSPHVGAVTSLRLVSPLSADWSLESEVGIGVASSLTAQADHEDVMSLTGVFLQASVGVHWNVPPR